ncbi:hypothetical protein CEXT_751651 [Caerostris extrusa]|uniref:Uncharacterized protein n=1 Tax=Caerostris extrusa TaxID=172846 RepID=A0AAV4NMK1_CAEEX|nr:hypothetical protein CEXT_751651 [Caerostris extrusa]
MECQSFNRGRVEFLFCQTFQIARLDAVLGLLLLSLLHEHCLLLELQTKRKEKEVVLSCLKSVRKGVLVVSIIGTVALALSLLGGRVEFLFCQNVSDCPPRCSFGFVVVVSSPRTLFAARTANNRKEKEVVLSCLKSVRKGVLVVSIMGTVALALSLLEEDNYSADAHER